MVASVKCGGDAAKGKGKMKSLMMTVVAALCCAAFADGKGAPPPGEGRPGGRGPHGGMNGPMIDPIVRMVSNPKAAEKLGLTEEQKAKLKEINKVSAANREMHKKVHEATMRQFELMKADKIDEAAVMKAIDEVFELRKEMAKAQVKRVIAVKSVLTPEQITKAREEVKKMFEQRGEKGQWRGEKGPRHGRMHGRGPRGGDRPEPPKPPEAK